MALCSMPSQSVIGQWCWAFFTVRGSFDRDEHRLCPQVVGIVKVWKDL